MYLRVNFSLRIADFGRETEVIEAANDTVYGLGCNVFSENLGRALRVAHQLEAGSAWVRLWLLCGSMS